jgi:hypothetical protein
MINESLQRGDLRNLINDVFEIDGFKSKVGNDADIVVVSFTVANEEAAKDLENFIEMGYEFVVDADTSTGETDDGVYKVFVEIERNKHIAEQITEMLDGISKLTNGQEMKFRYFKSFKSKDATEKNLKNTIPADKDEYLLATEENKLDNFQEFFVNSYADDIKLLGENISFTRPYSGTVEFKVIDSGSKTDIYNIVKGPIILESKDMAEVMFLTKVIGNYNITKIGNTFIFENKHWAVALKRIQ